jgi:hypothetical protein
MDPQTSRSGLRRAAVATASVQLALLFVAFALGASLYEHLAVDTVWPDHPQVIQPDQGGINRKLFWIPMHVVLTLALIAALVSGWVWPGVRRQLWIAIGCYAVMRVWSGLYFIPVALQFEADAAAGPALREAARTWVLLSMLRAPLLIGSLIALARASRLLRPAAPEPHACQEA